LVPEEVSIRFVTSSAIVKQDPGITQSGISEKMGKNKMVINYHIKILKDVGLLAVERNGRETNCFPTIAGLNLA
jgi:predicted transcriptional regulator